MFKFNILVKRVNASGKFIASITIVMRSFQFLLPIHSFTTFSVRGRVNAPFSSSTS